ncbi:hypothetical protein HDV04_005117 [Boothiomyces sp. JEL0838]|nr:hypothetical protein HDV04_005117 [Boothiomyces sp. JEL0838]
MQFGTAVFIGLIGGLDVLFYNTKSEYNYFVVHDKSVSWKSLVTHSFNHVDSYHLITNFLSITSSALLLDLGFIGSSCLYLTSVISGGLGFVAFHNDHQLIEIIKSDISKLTSYFDNSTLFVWTDAFTNWKTQFKTKYSLVGSSCAAYGFMGAEMVHIYSRITDIYARRYRKEYKLKKENDLAQLMYLGIFKTVQLMADLVYFNTCHLVGFCSGALFYYIIQ